MKRLRTYVAELQEEQKAKDYEIRRLQSRLRKISTTRDTELAKDAEVIRKDTVITSLKKHLRRKSGATVTL